MSPDPTTGLVPDHGVTDIHTLPDPDFILRARDRAITHCGRVSQIGCWFRDSSQHFVEVTTKHWPTVTGVSR